MTGPAPGAGRVALITGIAGQDGGYLAERLLADGWRVHGLTRRGDDTASVPTEVTLHEGDLTDRPGLHALVREVAPDHLYHLGGVTSVAASWADPEGTVEATGLSTVTLLQAALTLETDAARPVRFLLAGSAEIFGEPARTPQDEATPIAPVSPYGAAKALAHHAVGVFRQRGLFAVSLILYNHESPRRPASFVTRKITAAVAAIADGSAERLRLGNLEARRDWGWAPDVVDAMVRALAADSPGDYVIGTGESHAVRDLVATAFAHVGIADWARHVEIDPALVRPADPSDLRADPQRARVVLGWAPTRTFAQIVGAMVDADRAGRSASPPA